MPPELTDAQRAALEVLAYARAHGVPTRTARRSEVQFVRIMKPGFPKVSALAAASLARAGLVSISQHGGHRFAELTASGVDRCDAAGIGGEVAA